MTTSGVILGPRLTERAWQNRVTDLAALRRWRVFHDTDSRLNAAGLPDLIMVRRGRLIFAELKSESGRVSIAQAAWLTDLSACPGVEAFVWRPSDWPQVQDVLR